jgi:hypothetical protein
MQKAPKGQNTLQLNQNKDPPQRPLELPQHKVSILSKNGGDLKKMKVPIKLPKLQVIQPYLTFKTRNRSQRQPLIFGFY